MSNGQAKQTACPYARQPLGHACFPALCRARVRLTGVLFDQRPSRVIRVEEDLVDQFFNFSEKRLARVLLLFGQITKESKPESPLKVSQGTLAEMVGTTRARVSKFMNVFKKKGFVYYNGGLQINSALISAFLHNRPMSVVRRM